MRLVIVESPYAGFTTNNTDYARAAMVDSIRLGEAPIASHLLYTQPGILKDGVETERELGIALGLAWREVAELQVFYTDLGWSPGMIKAFKQCLKEKRKFELRALYGAVLVPPIDFHRIAYYRD